MPTEEFITALFYEVDEQLGAIPTHPEAHLWPSEVVTLGLLHALKGVGNRPFYRWLTRDYRPLFPRLPERTRLFRLLKTHQDWTRAFLAAPTVLGVIDTYGIELIHPMREGRSPQQIGRKGVSNHRWIVGGKLCLLLNQWGLIVGWACDTANVADNTALITALATLHPCRLSECSSRRTERRWRYLDGTQNSGKHRAGLLPEKSLRRGRAVRTREEKVVHGCQARTLSRVIESS